jgi:hypothetical protein
LLNFYFQLILEASYKIAEFFYLASPKVKLIHDVGMIAKTQEIDVASILLAAQTSSVFTGVIPIIIRIKL